MTWDKVRKGEPNKREGEKRGRERGRGRGREGEYRGRGRGRGRRSKPRAAIEMTSAMSVDVSSHRFHS